jgi:L-aspartate oxidase
MERRRGRGEAGLPFPRMAAKSAAYDFVVVGSGIAGLSFALQAAQHGTVLVLTKQLSGSGSTRLAQGGIASVLDPADSLDRHVQDTLIAGAGLCRRDRVEILVSSGPEAVRRLVNWGAHFTRADTESRARGISFDLAREGGHSGSRIVHAADGTGREIQRALIDAVRQNRNITVRENMLAIDLVTTRHLKDAAPVRANKRGAKASAGNAVHGVYALDAVANRVEMLLGAATLLCTGGVGQVYAHTTNDSVSTGDGIAMAYRAGAAVEDMEFMQFHPTAFYNPGKPIFLISEALRGHGGVLRTRAGKPFMEKAHPQKSLAPRDIVARAIDAVMKKTGDPCVYLDMTHLGGRADLRKHFPNIFDHCLAAGIDMSKQWIPVVPAAHFMCGGVQVDAHSATGLKNLYAVGEAACTGVHGANRLASNSLLEGVVFAERALARILETSPARPSPRHFRAWDDFRLRPAPETVIYAHSLDTIRSTMWHYVGIVRSDFRLARAAEFLRVISRQIQSDYWSFSMEPNLIELRNLTLCAELIVRSARRRRESRGLHFNVDHPERLSVARHTVLRPPRQSSSALS